MSKSKVIRISSGTEKVLEDLKFKLENMYYEHTGGQISIKEDDIIRNALIAQVEKYNQIE